MEIEVSEEKQNPLLNRKELKLQIKHAGVPTPSKAELTKELVSKYSVDENQVHIDYIFSIKGVGMSFAHVKILSEVKNETQTGKKL
jgi:small subunit ribosomal protein S24e